MSTAAASPPAQPAAAPPAQPADAPPPLPDRASILMSIKPEHMARIVARTKTHEFRRYQLPASVTHIWFYTSAPVQRLQFLAAIAPAKAPGAIDAADTGAGNADFNAGRKDARTRAYAVTALWRLPRGGVPLAAMKARGWARGPPQKYNWAHAPMVAAARSGLERVF